MTETTPACDPGYCDYAQDGENECPAGYCYRCMNEADDLEAADNG